MKTVKYIFSMIWMFILMFTFVLGICAADSSTGLCVLLMGGSAGIGYLSRGVFNYCLVYERAANIAYLRNK